MSQRSALPQDLAAGLAGWLQLQVAVPRCPDRRAWRRGSGHGKAKAITATARKLAIPVDRIARPLASAAAAG